MWAGRERFGAHTQEHDMTIIITNAVTKRTGTRSETIRQSYTASRREDCRDTTDRSVYDLVVMFGDVVTMGQTVGRPA